MRLPLAYYGDPVLRKKGNRVNEINDELRQLVDDMIETVKAENGIGLAAPQVHQSLALFITHVPIKQTDETWDEGPFKVFLNPKILSYSNEFWTSSEGCLSIPKLYGDVERPIKIVVEYTDMEGNRITEEFSGLEARCVMHENDHINGTLFIDRISSKARKEMEPSLREIKKKYKR